jgi:hypothetical protein
MSQDKKDGGIFFKPSKPIVIPSTAAISTTKTATNTEDSSKWEEVAMEEKKPLAPEKQNGNPESKVTEINKQETKRKREISQEGTEKHYHIEKVQAVQQDSTSTAPHAATSVSEKPVLSKSKEQLSSSTASLTKKTFGLGLTGATFSDLAKTNKSTIFSEGTTELRNETKKPAEKPIVQEDYRITTGEENDIILVKARVTLRVFDSDAKEWKQRGQGPLHVNISSTADGNKVGRLSLFKIK